MMAKHPRQIIRERLAAQLRFKTAAQDRVFTSRKIPLRRIELPALAVYTPDETSEPLNIDGDLERQPNVFVEGAVQLTEDVDDALDALAFEIEKAVGADFTFGGAVRRCHLKETHSQTDEEAAKPIGVVQLAYVAVYETAAVPE